MCFGLFGVEFPQVSVNSPSLPGFSKALDELSPEERGKIFAILIGDVQTLGVAQAPSLVILRVRKPHKR